MVAILNSFCRTQLPVVQTLSNLQYFYLSPKIIPTYHHSPDYRLLCSPIGQVPHTIGGTHTILHQTILRDISILQGFTQGPKLSIGCLKII